MIEKKYVGNENDNLPILSAGLEMQWRAKKRVSKLTKLPTMFGEKKKTWNEIEIWPKKVPFLC
jgi:hypothetical protein